MNAEKNAMPCGYTEKVCITSIVSGHQLATQVQYEAGRVQ